MINMTRHFFLYSLLWLMCVFLAGCGDAGSALEAPGSASGTSAGRNNEPQVLVPSADGLTVASSDIASIDASHTDQGYVMVRCSDEIDRIRLQILSPDDVTYTYFMTSTDSYETFPLTAGDGSYMVCVYENIAEDKYALILSQDLDVTLENEFLPFLYPNQYVNFSPDDKTVQKAAELARDCETDLDVIRNVFYYVVENITYDYDLAENVEYGYLPDNTRTLESKAGICFDFASLMTAMLRSQKIPTRLDVGYAGDAYHAWLSTYTPETGWIENIIRFDGSSWTLMDPTFASQTDGKEDVVGDGSSYLVKYVY